MGGESGEDGGQRGGGSPKLHQSGRGMSEGSQGAVAREAHGVQVHRQGHGRRRCFCRCHPGVAYTHIDVLSLVSAISVAERTCS